MALINRFPQGGALAPINPLDPMQVYKSTRPSDWLPMPADNLVQDDEMYLLFHIPQGFSNLIAFTTSCTGNYTVELGTMTNGEFVSDSTKTQTIASETKYENELFASDFGNLTSDGMMQCMIRISGTNITAWEPSTHNGKPLPDGFSSWCVKEIKCKTPSVTSLKFGHDVGYGLVHLAYVSILGETSITDATYMFSSCSALMSVLQFDTSSITKMYGTFNCCYALAAIPSLNTANVTNMQRMFQECRSLRTIPMIETEKVTSVEYMFNGCGSLVSVPPLNLKNVFSISSMFSSCYSLSSIPPFNFQRVNNISYAFQSCCSLTTIPQFVLANVYSASNAFKDCFSLSSILLVTTSSWSSPQDLSFANASLSHPAIVNLFNGLPTITTAKVVTLTGNPGVSDLTDADKSIATGKGWTLAL